MAALENNRIIQIGIVVRDIEKTARMYAEMFGMEMPQIRQAFPNIVYRNTKPKVTARLCSFPMGEISLELIQPGEEDTSWKEYLDEHGEGVHHIGLMVDDLEKAYQVFYDKGIERRQYGGAGWGSYTIMDSKELGVLFNVKCAKPVEGDME